MSEKKEVAPINEASIVGFDQTFIDLIKQIDKLTNKIINKPTTKEKVFPVNFVVDKYSIKDIFETINTKLNDYKIDEKDFSIAVLYNDKSFIPFPTFDNFMDDHETKPICAKNVRLKRNMKIFFEGRHNPIVAKIGEEHSIEINISVAPDEANDADKAFFIFNGYPVESRGVIQVTVNHSNKVWADEVIQHVSDYVERIKNKAIPDKNILQKNRKSIGKLLEAVINLSPVIPLAFVFFNINNSLDKISTIARLGSIAIFLFIVSQLFSFSIGKKLYSFLGKNKVGSWIILNEYTKQLYEGSQLKTHYGAMVFAYFLLPLFINIISAIICWRIGL